MSWFGYKAPTASKSTVSPRTAKRDKLDAERRQRAQTRDKLRKQVQEAQLAQQEADQAVQNLLAIDPDILVGDDTYVSESEIDNLLEDTSEDAIDEEVAVMVDFDQQNEDDSATAMDNLRSVQCPFNKVYIVFWFSQLEDQLDLSMLDNIAIIIALLVYRLSPRILIRDDNFARPNEG